MQGGSLYFRQQNNGRDMRLYLLCWYYRGTTLVEMYTGHKIFGAYGHGWRESVQ
jgi:hypothetical protein